MFGFSMDGVCRVSEGCAETDKKDSSDSSRTFIGQKVNYATLGDARVSVFDMKGKLVANRAVSAGFEITSGVVSEWVKSSGVYRVVVREGKKSYNIPVVVK